MKNQNNPAPTNFWFGFAVGAMGATSLAYLLGTKKGREKLRFALEKIEHMDSNPDELLTILKTLGNIAKQEAGLGVSSAQENEKKDEHRSSLETLIDKVKNITHEGKSKETFIKQK